MTTSPLLTGGAGFDFEDSVAAVYLTALLLESGVLGLGQYTVSQVALQRAASGAPLDDLIVTGSNAHGEYGTLHLQVKSTLHIGDGTSNTDFRDVLNKAWSTFQSTSFRVARDRVGAAVGSISQARFRAVRRLQELSFNSATSEDFWSRFDSVTNEDTRTVRTALVTVLRQIDPIGTNDQRLWRFFQHFTILQFDLHSNDGKDYFYAVEQLKLALKPVAVARAADLWRKLIDVARDVGDAGGSVDRPSLLHRLSPEFLLEAGRSSKADLERLSALAKATLSDIRLDINGHRVDRVSIIDKVAAALTQSRFVQITGEPGTGKSAVLRSIAEAEERDGFVFVLSEKRIEGNGWSGFAAANGLSTTSVSGLLAEIGAAASPTLFIDGIDRIVAKPSQQVVADILRAIATEPTCAKWRVVASVRDENIEHVRTWIPAEFLRQTGVVPIEIGLFDDEEANQIARRLPALAPLLNAAGPAREIARRPFFLRVLAEGVARGSSADAPRSEIELVEAWWSRGGYDATRADARRRQQLLRTAAERGLFSFGRSIDVQGLDAGALQDLIDDSVIKDVEPGLTVGFTHDVFFEWALFQLARSRSNNWLELVKQAGEPPFFGRVVGLLSQRAFERDEGWKEELESLETASARSQWRRAWLIAPFSSPLFAVYQSRVDQALVQNPERFRRLLLGFQAEKTQPNPLVLGGLAGNDLNRLARLRLADQLSWPSDFIGWSRLLAWFLPQCRTVPPSLVSDVLPVFEAWIHAFLKTPTVIPPLMKRAILTWLRAIEEHRHPEDVQEILSRDYESGWGAISDDELQEVERSLRFQFFLSTNNDPVYQKVYFRHLLRMGDRMHDACSFIAEHVSLIAVTAIPEAVDVCLQTFKGELPEEERERERGMLGAGMSHHDWDELSLREGGADFFPSSPAREPFRSFFQVAPQEALRLTRATSNHAMESWRQLNNVDPQFGRTPRPLVIKFPWGDQEFWGNMRVYGFYRGIHGPHLLDSALMSLEEWAFSELERGKSPDEIILEVVKDNSCCAALGIALEIAIESNSTTDVSLALLAASHLWLWDIARGKADLVTGRQNEFGFRNIPKNKPLYDALVKSNERPVRRQNIETLAMVFMVGQSLSLREKAKAAILALPSTLPYECDEDAGSADVTAYLQKQAKAWTLLADTSHYRLYKTDQPDKVAVGFENPEASRPEVIARANEARESLSWFALAQHVQKILDDDTTPSDFSLPDAIAKVQKEDATALLNLRSDEPLVTEKQMAVVAVAAVVANQSNNAKPEEIEWARSVLQRGAARSFELDEKTHPGSIIVHHPARATAKGLSFLIQAGIDERWAKETLLQLMLHPLEGVYETVVQSCLDCWRHDSRFSWIALCLGFDLANQDYRRDDWKQPEKAQERREAARKEKLVRSLSALRSEAGGWMEVPRPGALDTENQGDVDESQKITRMRRLFRHDLALRVLKHTPLQLIIDSANVSKLLLNHADRLLVWTIAAHPPRRVEGRRAERSTPPYEWSSGFMGWLSSLCAVISPELALSRYIDPILAIEDDDACLELLARFTDSFVCREIHDAETLSVGALTKLKAIADRVSNADWRWDARRATGNLTHEKHAVLKALFLVNVERADGARRFANGDWSEVSRVLPALVNLFQKLVDVTGALLYFLKLAECGIDHYPTDALADTLTEFLKAHENKPAALRSISAPERMAAMVQIIASREHPVSAGLRGRLLKLLDMLVELGDRRSAALLGSEWFKTTRRTSG